MTRYLNDRHSTEGSLLSAERKRDQRILDALRNIGAVGSVHHLVSEIPDQFEDFYAVLLDISEVVTFGLSRSDPAVPDDLRRYSVAAFRDMLGQGKSRIRLDRLVQDAKDIAKQQPRA